ncbi:hypothetical protein [Luteolibacter marinus]|uniref:hypothetical protein n=1 Tax=Luteolibacter marinus TaxID=2776705 RepID=UPI001867D170|nr:hypothetical protein [Luteolibacter marinus]
MTVRELLRPLLMVCLSSNLTAAGVKKPLGTFASSGALDPSIYAHAGLRGVLVRVPWKDVEPSPGVFQFEGIVRQAEAAEAAGVGWSLAILGGGVGSPDWLIDTLGVPYLDYTFRGEPGYRLPLFWDATVQTRLAALAMALGSRFAENERLKLVYVTQMTSNGIEGHLQGVNMAAFAMAGYTDERWVAAGKGAALAFASAFPAHPIAFEVHDVNGGPTVPARILGELWDDPALDHRVGGAVWWVSGNPDYQAGLLGFLRDFPGDLYGQVIARSDQTERLPEEGYAAAFAQAMELGLRYLEPWEFEFKPLPGGAGGAWDTEIAAFNAWADAAFGEGSLHRAQPTVEVGEDGAVLRWTGVSGFVDRIESADPSMEWSLLETVVPTVDGRRSLPLPDNGSGSGIFRIVRPEVDE